MKEFIQVLRRFVPPYKKYLILHIIFNVLSAILNIFSFMLIVPILQILFKMQEASYTFIPWDSAGSFTDIAINNFYYHVILVINVVSCCKGTIFLWHMQECSICFAQKWKYEFRYLSTYFAREIVQKHEFRYLSIANLTKILYLCSEFWQKMTLNW